MDEERVSFSSCMYVLYIDGELELRLVYMPG